MCRYLTTNELSYDQMNTLYNILDFTVTFIGQFFVHRQPRSNPHSGE